MKGQAEKKILKCHTQTTISKVDPMNAEIHPQYEDITATCSCGNVVKTRSTVCEDIHLEVCSQCHPFYTGKQKMIDTAGRIDRFNKRFGARGASK